MAYQFETDLPRQIFRAYDIRGLVGEGHITPNVIYTLGYIIGIEIAKQQGHSVVIGRDARLSSPELSRALSQGLLDSGQHVIDIGEVPTPLLYFSTHMLETDSGVMLTASHNPADHNGLKIIIQGQTLSDLKITELYHSAATVSLEKRQGELTQHNILESYIHYIKETLNVSKRFKVVIDCGNAVAGNVAPRLFSELGCDVIPLFCEVDGRFPNHHPDPSRVENLQDLINAVKEHQADLGLAFDGDADRLGVVTHDGKIIWPDRQMMLFAAEILDRYPNSKVIYDVKCSAHLAQIIRQHKGKPLMWKTGHSFIKTKMKEEHAIFAGEMSGHLFFKDRWFGFDDGMYAGARLLEILSKDPRSSGGVFDDFPDSVNTPELKVYVDEDKKFNLIETLKAKAHFPDAQVLTLDGLRVEFSYGWGLVRASNTSPCLTLRFEADDQENLFKLQILFKEQLLQCDATLSLPF